LVQATVGVPSVGCGAGVYLTKAPTLADILKAISERYVQIDRQLIKHPIPDPPPDWASELLTSLEAAEALAAPLEALPAPALREAA
jgi:hypothetical protein